MNSCWLIMIFYHHVSLVRSIRKQEGGIFTKGINFDKRQQFESNLKRLSAHEYLDSTAQIFLEILSIRLIFLRFFPLNYFHNLLDPIKRVWRRMVAEDAAVESFKGDIYVD